MGETAAESSWIFQPETPQDRSFLRSGIWKTLALFTFPWNDLQDLAPRLTSPWDFISLPEREIKWVQEMFFILNMVLFSHLLHEFSTQSQCRICKYVFFTEFDEITQHFLIWPKSILQNIIFCAALWVGEFFASFLFSKVQGWNTLKHEPDTILRPAGVKEVWHQICTEITAVFADRCAFWIRPLNSGCFFPRKLFWVLYCW